MYVFCNSLLNERVIFVVFVKRFDLSDILILYLPDELHSETLWEVKLSLVRPYDPVKIKSILCPRFVLASTSFNVDLSPSSLKYLPAPMYLFILGANFNSSFHAALHVPIESVV